MSPVVLPIEIDVHAVKSLLAEGAEFMLLDCREPDECVTARIVGATHIPMQQVPTRVAELDAFRDKRVVVHCHHGGRSLRVTQWLRQQGFPQAQNMTGGIDAWSIRIDPTVKRY